MPTKKTTGAQPVPARKKATSGDVADATPLPVSKTRAAVFEHIRSLSPAERLKTRADIKAHPDSGAMNKLEEYLCAAHLDPLVLQSQTLKDYVFLVRELLQDFVPGMSLQQMLEPLQTLMARHGGGRKTDIDKDMLRRHHARLVKNADYDATAQTAERFGISKRRVQQIVAEPKTK